MQNKYKILIYLITNTLLGMWFFMAGTPHYLIVQLLIICSVSALALAMSSVNTYNYRNEQLCFLVSIIVFCTLTPNKIAIYPNDSGYATYVMLGFEFSKWILLIQECMEAFGTRLLLGLFCYFVIINKVLVFKDIKTKITSIFYINSLLVISLVNLALQYFVSEQKIDNLEYIAKYGLFYIYVYILYFIIFYLKNDRINIALITLVFLVFTFTFKNSMLMNILLIPIMLVFHYPLILIHSKNRPKKFLSQ